MNVQRLKRRSDFVLLTKRGHRQVAPAFVLQTLATNQPTIRIGFTASKKIGNAVERNRAKRRLRALVDDVLAKNPTAQGPILDMVLVARFRVLDYTYDKLKQDLTTCLTKLGYTV